MKLGQCKKCSLSKTRTQVCIPRGSITAKVMFVGEAPGEKEDKEGVPFIGPAGQYLEKIIKAMGLKEGDYYITNVVKCRPVKNGRNAKPSPGQISRCAPYLDREIKKIKPLVLIALGGYAKDRLLDIPGAVGKFVGNVYENKYGRIYVMYHPASILYNKEEMIKAFKKHIKYFKIVYQDLLLEKNNGS